MILCIAERAHTTGYPAEKLQRWEELWRNPGSTTRCILTASAMTHGATRKRLENVLGLPPETRVVNLLWPDEKIGTWDHGEAKRCAAAVVEWLASSGELVDEWVEPPEAKPTTALVLLGRRVGEAFGMGAEPFGTRREYPAPAPRYKIPAVLVPHPSGRSRQMNDEDVAAEMRAAIRSVAA